MEAAGAEIPSARSRRAPVLTEESVHSVLSAVEREGRWDPADDIFVRAIFGAVKLDFTHADLPESGIVDLDVRAIFGSVEIIVPDGAEIIVDATPILGSVERKMPKDRHAARNDSADGEPPSFHIVGQAIFGSIEIIGR